jgi:hypothetical protein
MLTLIGQAVGENWERWKDSLHYVDYAVAASIVLGALWLYVRSRRKRGGNSSSASSTEATGEPAADATH